MRRLFAVAMLLLVALGTMGCKMNVDMTTTVLSSGEMDQEMVIKMEGFGDMSQEQLEPGSIAQAEDGWETEAWTEGDAMIVRSYKRIQPGDPMFPPGQAQEEGTQPEFNLEVVDTPEGKEYRLLAVMKPNESANPAPSPEVEEMDPETRAMIEEMTRAMMEMFSVTWTINLPGEVVETNADIQTEHGGTWIFSLDQTEPREMTLVTREAAS